MEIRAEKLEIAYGDYLAVKDMDVRVEKGKITTIIGPNGSGKSTVLKALTRLLNYRRGAIYLDARSLRDFSAKELARHIGVLPQIHSAPPDFQVKELVSYGRMPYQKWYERCNDEDQKIIDRAIAYMELEEFQDRFIDELSGGQRQRALIAMVIAQDTEYVLLDEPTNNLDIYHATNMMKIVRRLCDELGKTVILVLHEINYAAFYSDYICAFKDGKIAKFGTVEEVMTKENLSQIYQVDFEILTIAGKPLSIYY